MPQAIPQVVLEYREFEEIGDRECECCDPDRVLDHAHSRILSTLQINDTLFHVEGIAVREDDQGQQVAACVAWDERLDKYSFTFEPDGGWATVELAGRQYVLFLEPHSG